MLGVTITFLTFVLILVTLFMMLVILMQRPNTNAGMGAAFGGGVTESTFGAETTNILTRATKWSATAFFVLTVLLFVLYLVQAHPEKETAVELPTIEEPAAPADGAMGAAVDQALADAMGNMAIPTAEAEAPAAVETPVEAPAAVETPVEEPVPAGTPGE